MHNPNQTTTTLEAYVSGVLQHVRTFPTFLAAALYGQRHYGYGKFHVNTGNDAPSREEQLNPNLCLSQNHENALPSRSPKRAITRPARGRNALS